MGRLDGKVAFLTGGGAGIAKATAKAYVREGAKVALAEIDREAGERAQREIGDAALFVHTDVTNDEAVARAIAATVERFGRLDILFNCAGGSLQEDKPVHEMSLEIWQRTIALNLLHPFLACRHGIPHMFAAGGGSIINFASHLGMIGTEKPAYAAAKGGIVSFTKTLAAQYADRGIRANAIAPAIVRTERSIKRWESKDAMPAGAPTRSIRERAAKAKLYPFSTGEPEHIAAIGVFLASDESRMINGTTIVADGGRSSYLKVLAE